MSSNTNMRSLKRAIATVEQDNGNRHIKARRAHNQLARARQSAVATGAQPVAVAGGGCECSSSSSRSNSDSDYSPSCSCTLGSNDTSSS